MASLALPSPSSCSTSSSSSPCHRRRRFIYNHSRIPASANNIRCEISRSLNGKPLVPVINEGMLPNFTQAGRLNHSVINGKLKIFSGTANSELSREIARYMGLDLGMLEIKWFADGEIYVQLQESVRGCDVYLVQPTSPPANENLMELLVTIDACRRASAKNITAVIPYFGYARADRKTQGRESIAAKLVANLITEAGADRVLACDLHSGQSIGYFDIPVDHVYCQPVILDYLASKSICSNDLVVVSPDVGGVARARAFAKKLSDAPLAIVDKRRQGHNVAEVMNLIGDVKGKVAVMLDDMIDTAGTISKGAALLHEEGAREVYACCTHGVFSPPAIERLSSGLFQEVIVTNTIPLKEHHYFPQLTVLSVANLLGETIWRVHVDSSVIKLKLCLDRYDKDCSNNCWYSRLSFLPQVNSTRMACKRFLECLLKLLNFLLTLVGLAMVGYGIYLFVMYKNATDDLDIVRPNEGLIQLGRPMLMSVSLSSNSFYDSLPTAWFIYLFIGVGAVLFVISCCGCIGAATRNGCCLTCYSLLVILLILAEVGCAAFIFFDKTWRSDIPIDKTGQFDTIYDFLRKNWNICKWVALGAVILQALIFLLALAVRAVNAPAEYDSDDEYINWARQQRQPLISRQPVPATGIPVTGTLDSRPSRNDAWSARMREKYGLDTSEFTYNPNDPNRYQQGATQPTEEKSSCAIM
ncbi:hypothetical protein L1987_42045 [Smallanthus sonchifolius]|uniref:Uncharacterized protein n=1 Tax=Smallanthus sonchifolius TaxID=185202 RepID=A0ACB9GVW5_9ASTR|nr:hypothetical protein L1987_42045 [Smallanthus sonchifolius]